MKASAFLCVSFTLLLTIVLALPVAALAGPEPKGVMSVLPSDAADADPGTRASNQNDIFFVRNFTCRTTANTIFCGPDPIINTGSSFNVATRVFIPVSGSYNLYIFICDVEGNVQDFAGGSFSSSGQVFHNFATTFAGLSSSLYKVVGLVIANTNNRIAFTTSDYIFRVTPSVGTCCP